MLLTLILAGLLGGLKADTLVLDTTASVIHWKGTKFFGLGKHEGDVRLQEGYVVLGGSNGISGRFVVNMRSIEVTDIPADDPIPRNRLRNHLLDADFFDVERFPTANFTLHSGEELEDGRYRLRGALTMRGVTRTIIVEAAVSDWLGGLVRATSSFRINRHNWGVSFRGSRLTNDLVDDDIHFSLDLILRSPGRSS
jgi:polyisoprenoid-binding protein YceI